MKRKEKLDVEQFLRSQTKRELSESLGVAYKILTYNLHKLPDNKKYTEFEIKKRNGGARSISAPISGIKHIQKNLSQILLELYPQKNCVHGYSSQKGIVSNANVHLRKRYLVNIDLANFFPSINFGRVRGLFLSHPFNFNEIVATALAQICCHKGFLPQGAPSSPIVSNFICRKLDNQFLDLAKKIKFNYTRYADDITFSTNRDPLPKEIGLLVDNQIIISDEVKEIINNNGFEINTEKVRFATRRNRQEVTGLIVNNKTNVNRKYIRHVRAMINAWEKYGIEEAAREHFEKYNHKFKTPKHPELSFQSELLGKIGFIGQVRGRDDSIYNRFYKRIKARNPEVKIAIIQNASEQSDRPIIYGEGKTDWKHLKTALLHYNDLGKFLDLEIKFEEYKDGFEINNSQLLNICKGLSKTTFHKTKIICLFDRDSKKINNEVCENGENFKHWGNNVYSVLLPIPPHRNFDEICIEHFYIDDDLKIKDKRERRLFLSNEFNTDGQHLSEDLICADKKILKALYPKILDNKIFREDGENVALTKNAFAENIFNKEERFDKVSFNNFECVFDLLTKVVKHK